MELDLARIPDLLRSPVVPPPLPTVGRALRMASGRADVVYGSRTLREGQRGGWMFYLGGRFISAVTNLLYATHLTDEPTCYKMFRREDLQQLNLRARGFEFCPEVTAKAARLGWRIHEIPIRYEPRSFEEGKKISWKDGVRAIWELLRWRFTPIRSFYKPGKTDA